MDFEPNSKTCRSLLLPQPLYNSTSLSWRRTKDLQRTVSKGKFHVGTSTFPPLVCTEERRGVAQSPGPHPHTDSRNIIQQRAPLTHMNSHLNPGCTLHLLPLVLSPPISHLPWQSVTTLRVQFSSSGGWRQHHHHPSEYPVEGWVQWWKMTGASNSASTREAEFPLSFVSLFWAFLLGFLWWKGSTAGTLLTFFTRQGLAHLHLVPSGSLNDVG